MCRWSLFLAISLLYAVTASAQSHSESAGPGQIYTLTCAYSVDWPGHNVHIDATVNFNGTGQTTHQHVDGWEHAYTEVDLLAHMDNPNIQSIDCGGDDTGDGGGDEWDSGWFDPPAWPVSITNHMSNWLNETPAVQGDSHCQTGPWFASYGSFSFCQAITTICFGGCPNEQPFIIGTGVQAGNCRADSDIPHHWIVQHYHDWYLLGFGGSYLDSNTLADFYPGQCY